MQLYKVVQLCVATHHIESVWLTHESCKHAQMPEPPEVICLLILTTRLNPDKPGVTLPPAQHACC